ncbi:MAG TPA: HD domain-containing phosphohydrolase [Burkholderiaceae bacterium]|nr:HD domain-containing phosphohydrolase [Burkholderiaceae bacterium]
MTHYYRAAQPDAGLAPARDAVEIARRLGDPSWLCKALKCLGGVLADTRDIPNAIECYAEAIEIARRLGDVTQECALWLNTGVAYYYSAHYADAVACYERVIEIAGPSAQLQATRRSALSNIAGAALFLGDAGRGLNAIQQVIKESCPPETAADMLVQVFHEHHYTRLLLEVGLVDQARERAKLAKEVAERSRSARAEVLAAIAEGLTEVHSGNTDIGLTRLKRALERARSDMPGMLHDALPALIKGYEAAGQPDAALVYLREMKRLHQDGREAQVLMHHSQYQRRIDASLDNDAKLTLDLHQSVLRGQLSDRDLMRSRTAMLEQQSVAAELHDDTTGEHCYRVGRMSSLLAREYGVDDHTCFLIDLAARMHDIGKLAVPDAILLKPGKLTPQERAIMETHTTSGAELLAKSNVPQMYVAEEIARHHHERFDGTGYPARLKGSMIPLAARITALADVFDALTHVRPYKHAWTVEDSLREIASLRGKHFDPELTDLFLALVPRLQREKGDLDAYLAEEAQNSPFIRARRQIAAALKKDVNDLFDTRR